MTAPLRAETPSPCARAPAVRPRVLHCVTHLAMGGAERIALTLMEALRDEFSFAVYAVRGLGDGEVGRALQREIRALDIPLYCGPRVPMRFGGMITGGLGLARAVSAIAPDLIHLHTEIPEASCAAMLLARPGRRALPLLRTIHNSMIWEFWRPLGRWCDRKTAHAHIAGVSHGAIEAFRRLRRESGAPSPPGSPALIYNGVHPPGPPLPRPPVGNCIRVVFGGRLEREKGADLLPQILAQAPPPGGRRACLMIYGSGTHAALLAALARRPPSGWSVELHPPTPDFTRNLAAFDLAIIPSRHEGLCLVAIEAALAGLPLLVTDAPGLREVVPDKYPLRARTGDAASFAALLRLAFSSRDRWSELAGATQNFAREHFDVRTMANAYCTLYRQILRSTPPT